MHIKPKVTFGYKKSGISVKNKIEPVMCYDVLRRDRRVFRYMISIYSGFEHRAEIAQFDIYRP